ncbi:hypothetical protein [Paraburkholderia sp. J41]|uniref:hypothetical protein n=1 Tax=Paraburkholderia sp. J41 TaxID=2805433 RepID=UPI002AC36717|nr:hypothetical protein [Paraburkholderia sp. J41]
MELLDELCRQLAPMVPAFEKQHGCWPTVAIVPTALMRRLVGNIPNCVVYVGRLVVLADPTVDAPRLSALEIPDSLRPTPSRPEPDMRALH